ncbi:unnamed protein product [Rotaria sp. Silwood1]|nr:unnamed protein product [Rotaria sp. Silwood1]
MCSLQLFPNATCNKIDACRTDLNLSCAIDCYGSTTAQPNVTTAVGSCNGLCNQVLSRNLTTLHYQGGIFAHNNGTLYVADGTPTNTVFVFEPNQQIGRPLMTFADWPTYIYVDNTTSNIYVTILNLNFLKIWPSNATIPPSGITASCTLNKLNGPTNFVFDSLGNIYISSYSCHWVTKWAPNATTGTHIAGSTTGTAGSTNQLLNLPYGLVLDESYSALYVSDRNNHRIQKFTLGNSIAITVAGGYGAGSASNQLNRPTTIIMSQIDAALYICDSYNNRIQKWAMGASFGITIAGSANGMAGNTLNLFNTPYDIWIDSDETYLLISDTYNCRVQRYALR